MDQKGAEKTLELTKEKQSIRKETEQKQAIVELKQKISDAYQATRIIDSDIVLAYKQLLEEEKKYHKYAQSLGVNFSSNVSEQLAQELMETRKKIQRIRARLEKLQVREDFTNEQIIRLNHQLDIFFDKIKESLDMSNTMPRIIDEYKEQSMCTIKRELYEKMVSLINGAKKHKLEKERQAVEKEDVGLLGKITGKEKLKRARLDNIDLKMELLNSKGIEHKNHHSVEEMLIDIYTFKTTEMEGELTPELTELFELLRSNFKNPKKERYSMDCIRKLSKQRIEEYRKMHHLTSTPNSTKDEINYLNRENAKLQEGIKSNKRRNNNIQTLDVVSVFRQRLIDIARNFTEEKISKSKASVRDTIEI